MLKHAFVALMLASSVTPAFASPELAEAWGVKASSLYGETVALLDAAKAGETPALTDDYVSELERFAVTAHRLGTWNDTVKGAGDFGCIFRGMSEEAELQLSTIETAVAASERAPALKRLVAMFDDAQIISAAAAHAARNGKSARTDDGPRACPANPAMMDHLSRY